MTTTPQISAVLVAEDANSALRMVENHQPALIILGLSLSRVQAIIKEIKTRWPRKHLIVIVEDVDQQKAAEASGADNVLLEGFPTQKLVVIVERIIDGREDTPPVQADTDG
jgi:DNA-binding NarL/FixJ family response regulator